MQVSEEEDARADFRHLAGARSRREPWTEQSAGRYASGDSFTSQGTRVRLVYPRERQIPIILNMSATHFPPHINGSCILPLCT